MIVHFGGHHMYDPYYRLQTGPTPYGGPQPSIVFLPAPMFMLRFLQFQSGPPPQLTHREWAALDSPLKGVNPLRAIIEWVMQGGATHSYLLTIGTPQREHRAAVL